MTLYNASPIWTEVSAVDSGAEAAVDVSVDDFLEEEVAEEVGLWRQCGLDSADFADENCHKDIHGFLSNTFDEKVSGQAYRVLLSWLLHLYKEWIGLASVRELVLQAPSLMYRYAGREDATKETQLQDFRKWWKGCLALLETHPYEYLPITFVNYAKIGHESHYVGLVYRRSTKTFYYFDPSMGQTREEVLYSESRSHFYIDNLAILEGLTVRKIFPPKRCQRSRSDTYCQTWVLLFHHFCLKGDLGALMVDRKDKERERQIVQAIKAYVVKEKLSFDEYVRADSSVNNSVVLACKWRFSPAELIAIAESSAFFY